MYPSRIHSIQSIVVVVVWPTDNLCKTITVNITTIPLSADITHDTLIQWYTQHKMQDRRVFAGVGMQSCKITLISTFAIFLATRWKNQNIYCVEWQHLWQNDQNTPCQDRVKLLTDAAKSKNIYDTCKTFIHIQLQLLFRNKCVVCNNK